MSRKKNEQKSISDETTNSHPRALPKILSYEKETKKLQRPAVISQESVLPVIDMAPPLPKPPKPPFPVKKALIVLGSILTLIILLIVGIFVYSKLPKPQKNFSDGAKITKLAPATPYISYNPKTIQDKGRDNNIARYSYKDGTCDIKLQQVDIQADAKHSDLYVTRSYLKNVGKTYKTENISIRTEKDKKMSGLPTIQMIAQEDDTTLTLTRALASVGHIISIHVKCDNSSHLDVAKNNFLYGNDTSKGSKLYGVAITVGGYSHGIF